MVVEIIYNDSINSGYYVLNIDLILGFVSCIIYFILVFIIFIRILSIIVIVLFEFYGWSNEGLERLSNLLLVI